MAEINIQEALSITKKMANHFMAFEKLYEVTQMLASAERVLEERKKAKLALDAEMEKMKDVMDMLKKDFETDKVRFKMQQQNTSRQLAKLEEETAKKVFICEERQKQAEELAKTAEERAAAEYKKAMDEYQVKTEAAKVEMIRVMGKLDHLKKSIATVGD